VPQSEQRERELKTSFSLWNFKKPFLFLDVFQKEKWCFERCGFCLHLTLAKPKPPGKSAAGLACCFMPLTVL
jgi:hypothetical protein